MKCSSRDFYEVKTDNGSLPVFAPINPSQKPDLAIVPQRTRTESYPGVELAHTYLSILDQLWQIRDVIAIQRPFTLESLEFHNIRMTYTPAVDAPVIFTSLQASWATLGILDAALKQIPESNPRWNPQDWAFGNNKGTFGTISCDPVAVTKPPPSYQTAKKRRWQARRRSNEPDSLSTDLAVPPSPQLQVPSDALSLADFDAIGPLDTADKKPVAGDDEVTVDVNFYQGPLPYKQVLYHLRVFILMAMKSEATGDVSARWPRDRTLDSDPRVKDVAALMVLRGPRGLFPPPFSFADFTNGLRQILAKCIRNGEFTTFRAAIRKEGIVVAELIMKPKAPNEVASA